MEDNRLLQAIRKESGKQGVIEKAISIVCKRSKKSFEEIIQMKEEERLRFVLTYITTTRKVVSLSFLIPIENGCRAKRNLEKAGLLVQTPEKKVCPHSTDYAHVLTCNPELFEDIRWTGQYDLFR